MVVTETPWISPFACFYCVARSVTHVSTVVITIDGTVYVPIKYTVSNEAQLNNLCLINRLLGKELIIHGDLPELLKM